MHTRRRQSDPDAGRIRFEEIQGRVCVRNCITSRLRFDIRVLEGFTGRCSQDPFIFYRRTFIFAALWSVLLAYDKSSHQEVRPWKHLRR